MTCKHFFAALMAIIFLASPGAVSAVAPTSAHSAFPLTIVDDLGAHVRIAHAPRRILSLDPRDTETLFALGLERRLVGDGGKNSEGATGYTRLFHYPGEWPSPFGRDYPIRSKQLTHIEGGCCGTPWNLESITALRPDLIFSLNSDFATIQKMRDIGLNVIVLNPANLRQTERDVALVGRATGAGTQAKLVIHNMAKQVSDTERILARTHSTPRTYYELDATNPTQPYTAGPGTFIDEAIQLAHGKNVAGGITSPGCPGSGCYFQISLEALVQRNPEVVLLGDAAYGTTVASVKSRPGWGSIAAISRGSIYPINDELVSRAGPRIVIGIRKLASRIHPEAFRQKH